MKTLTLYLCTPLCAPAEDRDRNLPCLDESACTCGAAQRNRLILETRKAASDVSYHNAAEGNAWRRERRQAEEARQRFGELRDTCAELGLDWAQGEAFLL